MDLAKQQRLETEPPLDPALEFKWPQWGYVPNRLASLRGTDSVALARVPFEGM